MASRRYRGKVLEVHDIDTYKVEIDLGFYVTVKQWLRLKDFDGWELSEADGIKGRDTVRQLLPVGTEIYMDVTLVKTRAGGDDYKWTFRRFEARVMLPSGDDLMQLLQRAGLAKIK